MKYLHFARDKGQGRYTHRQGGGMVAGGVGQVVETEDYLSLCAGFEWQIEAGY
ncbi:MAG: hypothetical protein H6560_19465 [Lewinellaceae bacterium]|nr:hypothetical protein [Lewinellaceae bacterium]